MSTSPDIEEMLVEHDYRLMEYILSNKENELIQSEISKHTGLDSRVVSKHLMKLERMGLIRREEVIYKGRKTFRIIPSIEKISEIMKEHQKSPTTPRVLYEEVKSLPCITCPNINKCFMGGFYNPEFCPLLTEYLAKKSAPKQHSAWGK